MATGLLAEGCREIDFAGRRHYAGDGSRRSYERGGLFRDLSAAAARQLVKIGGAVASEAGTTARGIGYRCPACGFGSFVRRCSRCGAECERE
jgi:hypothetical protein